MWEAENGAVTLQAQVSVYKAASAGDWRAGWGFAVSRRYTFQAQPENTLNKTFHCRPSAEWRHHHPECRGGSEISWGGFLQVVVITVGDWWGLKVGLSKGASPVCHEAAATVGGLGSRISECPKNRLHKDSSHWSLSSNYIADEWWTFISV